MQYEVEDVGDAEAFEEECAALPDFSAMFESLRRVGDIIKNLQLKAEGCHQGASTCSIFIGD
ncbi:MAG: hypothetical protein ABI180_12290 [Microcoleus sp.]